jgi:2-polyprenyl-3-methyl-5-hydroxy-6-metoxy-1,4-benzoquinol methylase
MKARKSEEQDLDSEPNAGSKSWNEIMFQRHKTPYSGIPGFIERYRVRCVLSCINSNKSNDEPMTIVELGCGAGFLLKKIDEAFSSKELIGVDISTHALREAEKRLSSDVYLQESDISEKFSPPLHAKNIDYIICSETLEHLPKPKLAIENIGSIAESTTKLIVTVPIERYKNIIKGIFNNLRLFDLFFPNIEKGSSEWHLHDFNRQAIQTLLQHKFDIQYETTILLMHRLFILTPV